MDMNSGDGEGQGSLACCSPWSRKESDAAEQLNWNELNWDSILKSRDIILPTKVRTVKAMVFPVVMYGCESWTTKNAECQAVVLEKTLESPLDNKEIQPVNSETFLNIQKIKIMASGSITS